MSAESIVITSGKGGVGKTTISANLGTALAMNENRVCLIDADIGLRNLDVVIGLENRIVYDIVDVVEKNCRLEQALIRDKRLNNLFLLPAAQTRDKTAVTPYQMQELISALREEMDYIIVDSPAGIEQGFKNAIAGADQAIIVTTPEVSAVRDADRIIGLLEAEGLKNPEVIVNRIRMDMVKKGNMMDLDDMIEILAVNLLGAVPEDEGIVISTNKGEPVVYSDNRRAGQAFKNIARRLEGEELPLMSLEKDTIFRKIKNIIGLS